MKPCFLGASQPPSAQFPLSSKLTQTCFSCSLDLANLVPQKHDNVTNMQMAKGYSLLILIWALGTSLLQGSMMENTMEFESPLPNSLSFCDCP